MRPGNSPHEDPVEERDVQCPRTDCADDHAAVKPGATEHCDGMYANCSSGGGAAMDEDADGDGHTVIGATCIGRGEPGGLGSSYLRDDCNDGSEAAHGGLSASADTSTCDGLDNDCNPLTTELGVVCLNGGPFVAGATTRWASSATAWSR